MVPTWVSEYVGIPFADHGRDRSGCDCWGLVRLVLGNHYGVEVPSYAETYPDANKPSASEAVDTLRQIDFIPLSYPEPGAIVVLRVKGLPWHVGVMVNDHYFLHIMRGINAVCERIDGLTWANKVMGFYRYAGN